MGYSFDIPTIMATTFSLVECQARCILFIYVDAGQEWHKMTMKSQRWHAEKLKYNYKLIWRICTKLRIHIYVYMVLKSITFGKIRCGIVWTLKTWALQLKCEVSLLMKSFVVMPKLGNKLPIPGFPRNNHIENLFHFISTIRSKKKTPLYPGPLRRIVQQVTS